MRDWIFLAIAIFGEIAATAALKSSEGFTKLIPSVTVIIGYGVAFYFLALILKSLPMGIVYAVWSGVGIVAMAIIGSVLYNQKIDLWAGVGIGFIVLGVAIINLFSTTKTH